jgi:hypothetical protein
MPALGILLAYFSPLLLGFIIVIARVLRQMPRRTRWITTHTQEQYMTLVTMAQLPDRTALMPVEPIAVLLAADAGTPGLRRSGGRCRQIDGRNYRSKCRRSWRRCPD